MNLTTSFQIYNKLKVIDGGQGSGNFGHSGRPGQVGGSGSGAQATDEYIRGFMASIGLTVSNLMKNYGVRVEVFTKGVNRMLDKGEMPFKDDEAYEAAKKELESITDPAIKKKLQNAINRQDLYKKVQEYMKEHPLEDNSSEEKEGEPSKAEEKKTEELKEPKKKKEKVFEILNGDKFVISDLGLGLENFDPASVDFTKMGVGSKWDDGDLTERANIVKEGFRKIEKLVQENGKLPDFNKWLTEYEMHTLRLAVRDAIDYFGKLIKNNYPSNLYSSEAYRTLKIYNSEVLKALEKGVGFEKAEKKLKEDISNIKQQKPTGSVNSQVSTVDETNSVKKEDIDRIAKNINTEKNYKTAINVLRRDWGLTREPEDILEALGDSGYIESCMRVALNDIMLHGNSGVNDLFELVKYFDRNFLDQDMTSRMVAEGIVQTYVNNMKRKQHNIVPGTKKYEKVKEVVEKLQNSVAFTDSLKYSSNDLHNTDANWTLDNVKKIVKNNQKVFVDTIASCYSTEQLSRKDMQTKQAITIRNITNLLAGHPVGKHTKEELVTQYVAYKAAEYNDRLLEKAASEIYMTRSDLKSDIFEDRKKQSELSSLYKNINKSGGRKDSRFAEFFSEAAAKPNISNKYVNSNVDNFYVNPKDLRPDGSVLYSKQNISNLMPSLSEDFVDKMYKGNSIERGSLGKDSKEAEGFYSKINKGDPAQIVSSDNAINNILTGLVINGSVYSPAKEPNKCGILNQLNMMSASAPIHEGYLVRYENEIDKFRDYENLKPGDTFEMESQHFTFNQDFEKKASQWFGEGKPVRFSFTGKVPFFNLEPFVWKAGNSVKPTVESEGIVAGFVKVKSNKMKGKVRHIELEYDWEKHKDYLRLQAKAFAYKTKMYENN